MKIVLDFDSVYKNRIVELVDWLKRSGFIKHFKIENEEQLDTVPRVIEESYYTNTTIRST